jgi:hypothetical protein
MLLTAAPRVASWSGARECLFRGRGERGEAILVVHGQVGEDLAIHFDFCQREAVHEATI